MSSKRANKPPRVVSNNPNTKYRDYCYTFNNYTEEDYAYVQTIECVYHVIGKEIGEECGTPHLQGYIYFKNPRSWDAVRKLFKGCHIGPRETTIDKAADYCMMDGDFIEIGTRPEQGKRTDIETVREELNNGNGIRGVVRRATNLQQIKIAEAILKYEEPKRDWKPIVSWYWGLTGTGKSKKAHEVFEGTDFYRKTANTGKWWEGYDAHENVLIDDMDDTSYPYKNLLDLLDRYECRIECKNGTRQFLAKNIIITASMDPETLFQKQDQRGAELLRRIDHIIHFT